MGNSQSQNNQHGIALRYSSRRGCVASIIMLVSSLLAICATFVFSAGTGMIVFCLMIPIFVTSCIGGKARNRQKCWVRGYMIMAIISAVFAFVHIFITFFINWSCIPNDLVTTCTVKTKACFAVSLICGLVTFVATVTASCVARDGVCSCSQPLSRVSTQSGNVTAYRVCESEQERQIDVEPDVDGLYTHWKIEKAEPKQEQFDPEENYVMHTSYSKGLVLIINNDYFLDGKAKGRPGSGLDLINIQHIFKEIGYEPVIMKNVSANEIRSFLDESVSRINREASSHSSVVLVLMSHGKEQGICGTDMKVVTIQEIKSKFSGRQCPALLGKPKMFFIQACRGQMRTKSALDTDDPRGPLTIELVDDPDIDSCSSRRPTNDAVDMDGDVPDNADIYVAYATSEGYFSIRNRVDGSWFIQSLCEELIAHVHIDDLDTIMNRVTRRVTNFTGSVIDGKGKKKKTLQTPDISKQGIRKKIYFMPKYPPRSDAECSLTDQPRSDDAYSLTDQSRPDAACSLTHEPRSDAECSLTHQPGPSSEPQGHCSTHSE